MKKCTSFEEQKGTEYILEAFILTLSSSAVSTKPCLRFLLICFAREKKAFIRFPHEMGLMVKVSTKISAQNQNSKKLRHGFVDERAMNAITLISSCQENPYTFLLAKEKT